MTGPERRAVRLELPHTYTLAFDLGLADAISGHDRRWPRVRNRGAATQPRLGYDDGFHDGSVRQGHTPVLVSHLRLSGPDDRVHWTCPDCGLSCSCALAGMAHITCGQGPPDDAGQE